MKAMKVLAAVMAVSTVAAVSYAAGAAKKAKMQAASELKWEPMFPNAPIHIATLWGDRNKGESGILLKLPPGFDSGMHTHTADYNAVLLAGTWVHTEEGSSEVKELGPGSYVMQPGKQVHNDLCKAGAECVIFIHQKQKADFVPAKSAAAKK